MWADYLLVSPWALLGAALTEIAAADSWLHWVPGLSGTRAVAHPASLYVVTVAPRGGGKTMAASGAREAVIIPRSQLSPNMANRNIKSPEGIYDLFQRKVEVETDQTDENRDPEMVWRVCQTEFQARVMVDEIGALLKVGKRGGNWLTEAYSQWYTGLFPSNDSMTTSRPALAKNTHLSAYMGAQDHLAAGLLEGGAEEQGFTARLVMMDASYPEVRDTGPEPPPPIRVRLPDCGECPPCLDPSWKKEAARDPESLSASFSLWGENPVIARTIIADRKRFLRSGMIGGHDNLTRRRLSKHLAILHGEDSSTSEAWDMAGALIDHSQSIRDFLSDHLPYFLEKANTSATHIAVIKNTAVRDQGEKTKAIVSVAHRRLWKKHFPGFTRTDVNNILSGEERRILMLNGEDAGKPPEQVLAHLLHSQAITYPGASHRLPQHGEVFQFLPHDARMGGGAMQEDLFSPNPSA